MHELSTVEFLIKKLEGKKGTFKVKLGKTLGSGKTVEDFFNEMKQGTKAENADIEIEEVPVSANCSCGFEGIIEIHEHVHFVRCPKCNKLAEILEGNEIEIMD